MSTLDLDVPGITGTNLQAHRLHRLLGNALLCVSDDEEIPQLGAVYLDVDAETNRLTIAATDRYTVLVEHTEAQTNIGGWQVGIAAEDARLIRAAITSAEKEASGRDVLTVLLRPDAGMLRVDVGGIRLDVPLVDWPAPGFARILDNALGNEQQPMRLSINPTYFARVAKVMAAGDEKKRREPVVMTYCGERKPIRFAWGVQLHMLAMPYIGWDGDAATAEAAGRQAGA